MREVVSGRWRVGEPMDALLQRFLLDVRGRSRHAHLATYEDLALGLDTYLRLRRGAAARLPARELRAFLGHWYLRRLGPQDVRRTRLFCAAARVFVAWLTQDASPRRRRGFRRETKSIARAVIRAARASELLEQLQPARRTTRPAAQVDDYCEIVARGGSHLVLRPLSSRALLGPVAVPQELAASLDPGAFVNLRLGQNEGRWRILDYGLCYPPAARTALQAACAVAARP
jgi:hypothetical protein